MNNPSNQNSKHNLTSYETMVGVENWCWIWYNSMVQNLLNS